MFDADSKYFRQYYDHVGDKKITKGTLRKVFNMIEELYNRGLKEFNHIDAEFQDEIVESFIKIIEENKSKH